MAEGGGWPQLRDRRMAEPGAVEACAAARLAFELDDAAREKREQRTEAMPDRPTRARPG